MADELSSRWQILLASSRAISASLHDSRSWNLHCDALEVNNSPVNVRGDEALWTIARELVEAFWRNVSIEWTSVERTFDS
jgi:hypothetical protein